MFFGVLCCCSWCFLVFFGLLVVGADVFVVDVLLVADFVLIVAFVVVLVAIRVADRDCSPQG